jgi:phage tail protein X
MAPVLTAELRGAVVSDAVADRRHVIATGQQHQTRVLKTDLLLEPDRAESRDSLEVAMEGRGAHATRSRQLFDLKRLAVVLGDPTNGLPDVGEAAVCQAQLADSLADRSADQPPEYFSLDHRRQHSLVAGCVEKTQHANDGIEQLRRGFGDAAELQEQKPADGDSDIPEAAQVGGRFAEVTIAQLEANPSIVDVDVPVVLP